MAAVHKLFPGKYGLFEDSMTLCGRTVKEENAGLAIGVFDGARFQLTKKDNRITCKSCRKTVAAYEKQGLKV